MSIIRPFKGIRPRADLASAIAALPYDVYNSEEAREIVAAEPKSFSSDRPSRDASSKRHKIHTAKQYIKQHLKH